MDLANCILQYTRSRYMRCEGCFSNPSQWINTMMFWASEQPCVVSCLVPAYLTTVGGYHYFESPKVAPSRMGHVKTLLQHSFHASLQKVTKKSTPFVKGGSSGETRCKIRWSPGLAFIHLMKQDILKHLFFLTEIHQEANTSDAV